MTVDPEDHAGMGRSDRSHDSFVTGGASMGTITFLLLLYLKYFVVVLVLGVLLAAGLWFWLGLASFARSAREDR